MGSQISMSWNLKGSTHSGQAIKRCFDILQNLRSSDQMPCCWITINISRSNLFSHIYIGAFFNYIYQQNPLLMLIF